MPAIRNIINVLQLNKNLQGILTVLLFFFQWQYDAFIMMYNDLLCNPFTKYCKILATRLQHIRSTLQLLKKHIRNALQKFCNTFAMLNVFATLLHPR